MPAAKRPGAHELPRIANGRTVGKRASVNMGGKGWQA